MHVEQAARQGSFDTKTKLRKERAKKINKSMKKGNTQYLGKKILDRKMKHLERQSNKKTLLVDNFPNRTGKEKK